MLATDYNYKSPLTIPRLELLLKLPALSRTRKRLIKHAEIDHHSQRVAALCIDLAFENELPNTLVNALGTAALLHDIGKTKIPDFLLNKPGKLQVKEIRIMQKHVRFSYLAAVSLEQKLVAEIIVRHHEFGKNPYPRNSNERRRHPRNKQDRRQRNAVVESMSMILAVADLFDALVQERVYKPALSLAETEMILKSDFTGSETFVAQILTRFPN